MRSEHDILHDAGITVRRWQGNNARTICPECSPGRTKKTDPCLSVTRTPDGIVWHCHHCGHSGGARFEGRSSEQPKRSADRFANVGSRSFGGRREFSSKRRF